jgi:hypothetical protein
VTDEDFAEAEEDFGAARRGKSAPAVGRALRGFDRRLNVLRARDGEAPDEVA